MLTVVEDLRVKFPLFSQMIELFFPKALLLVFIISILNVFLFD